MSLRHSLKSPQVSYSSICNRKGEMQKIQNSLSNGKANTDKENSDDDADEMNMQDFIHNASQLTVV